MKFGAEALTGAEEVHWELLMSTKLVQPGVNIISLTKFFEHRQKVEQLGVVHVVKPRHHRDLPDTDCHSQTIGFDASLNKTYKNIKHITCTWLLCIYSSDPKFIF